MCIFSIYLNTDVNLFLYLLVKLPGGLLFKTASHTLIFRMNALSSCSTCDSNVSELQHQKQKQIMNTANLWKAK